MDRARLPAQDYIQLCQELRSLDALRARALSGSTTDDRFAAMLFAGLLERRRQRFLPVVEAETGRLTIAPGVALGCSSTVAG